MDYSIIKTKDHLKEYLRCEQPLYWTSELQKDCFLDVITRMPNRSIGKYLKLLRKTEYYYNNREKLIFALLYLLKRRKKNAMGQKLGIEIFENSFGKGLQIFHAGNIVVNGRARVGKNCMLHGSNCIGNDGYSSDAPIIGNNVRLGVGAKIIGNVILADDVVVAAGAVVVSSFNTPGVTIAGIPAREIYTKRSRDEN